MVSSALDDPGGDLRKVEVRGLQSEVGALAIAGVALAEHGADGVEGVCRLEQGPLFVAGGALQDGLGLGHEPDHEAELAQKLAILLAEDDPATSRDDALVAAIVAKAAQGLGLEVAEALFALRVKDFRNGALLLSDDAGVGVDERVAEGLGKVTTNRRLSSAHKSDQYEVLQHSPRSSLTNAPKRKNLYSGFVQGKGFSWVEKVAR